MPEEANPPPKRTAGRSISLPSTPFYLAAASETPSRPPPPPPPPLASSSRQLSRALSSHVDRCMSAHSYHARRRTTSSPATAAAAHASVIAAALGTRARRFSFVDEPLRAEEVEAEEAEEVEDPAVSPTSPPAPPPPAARGTVFDGSAILFTAIASFPALSLPYSVSTMGWAGVAAIALCGVATGLYSCWLVSYLVGYNPGSRRGEGVKEAEEGGGSDNKDNTAAAKTNDDDDDDDESDSPSSLSDDESDDEDFRHDRYHSMAAAILGHRTASILVTPMQVVVCFGICVSSLLIGGTCLKALSRLLQPVSSSSSSSSSPLTLSQWIAVYAAFQATSAFVPSLASSAAVAVAGSLAFLVFWLLATGYSTVAGIQNTKSSATQPLPADFYSLAATKTHEKAFAALNGLGIALFAWSNAFAPEVQATLRKPHDATMRKSTLAAFGLLIPCYSLIGALGYWAFGKDTNIVVLLNMEPASRGGVGREVGSEGGGSSFEAPRAAVAVAWVAVSVNLYALFAVYAFPVYECLDAFVAREVMGRIRERKEAKNGSNKNNDAPSSPLFASAVAARAAGRLLFCACCTLVAAALPFFGDIAAVLGVLSLALDFVLPCLMFLKVRQEGQQKKGKGKKKWKLSKVAASALLGTAAFYVLLGGSIMVAALRSLFLNAHTYKLFADM